MTCVREYPSPWSLGGIAYQRVTHCKMKNRDNNNNKKPKRKSLTELSFKGLSLPLIVYFYNFPSTLNRHWTDAPWFGYINSLTVISVFHFCVLTLSLGTVNHSPRNPRLKLMKSWQCRHSYFSICFLCCVLAAMLLSLRKEIQQTAEIF